MKIAIPEIKREIRLAEYAPEFGDAVITVRANPARELLARWDGLMERTRAGEKTDELSDAVNGVLGELWGWEPGEVAALCVETFGSDPALFGWLVTRTFTIIREHRAGIKKN